MKPLKKVSHTDEHTSIIHYNKYIPNRGSMTQAEQVEKDIAFCIDECGMNDEEIGNFLKAAEEIGVNCQYLAEEFIFQCDTPEEFQRIHLDDNYLKINWRLD